MATIRASCPDCGDVEFTTRDIQVSELNTNGSGSYRFSCPGCSKAVVKSGGAKTIDLLLASGVARSYPVTEGELKEFADVLKDGSAFEDAFRELVREMR